MEWISVKDKTPDLTLEAFGSRLSYSKLVLLDNGDKKIANYFVSANGNKGWNTKGRVIAWMDIVNSKGVMDELERILS